jgi:hypothetical protein
MCLTEGAENIRVSNRKTEKIQDETIAWISDTLEPLIFAQLLEKFPPLRGNQTVNFQVK